MKILFVCENYIPHYGGAEVVLQNLAENMIKRGHDVAIVTHQLKNTSKFEVMNGVKVYRIPCFDNRHLFTFFAVPKVIKLAKKADIIQTITFNGAPPSWLAAKIMNKPVVLTVLEVWVNMWRQVTEKGRISCALHNFLEKMIYLLKYTKYICISNATKKSLLRLNIQKNRVTTVYCGFDYSFWNKNKFNGKKIREKLGLEKNFMYFSWGRPGTSKGQDYILKAVSKIKKAIPNAKFVLMLSNKDTYNKRYNYLLSLIKQLHIEEDVLLLDAVSYNEIGNYIKAADCVVLPSLSEGFGYAVLEACELGVPVIGTDNASIPEVIWGKHVLIPPKNPEKIAEAVIKVYKGKYSISKKKFFDWEKTVDQYLEIYMNLIKKIIP